jgi:hypothetical protein
MGWYCLPTSFALSFGRPSLWSLAALYLSNLALLTISERSRHLDQCSDHLYFTATLFRLSPSVVADPDGTLGTEMSE